MKRDIDLIREILLRVEAMEHRRDNLDLAIEGYEEVEVDYNLDLLIREGFINGKSSWSLNHTLWATINGLEWEGHDLLDAIRSESILNRAKSQLASQLPSVPLAILKDVCLDLLRDLIA